MSYIESLLFILALLFMNMLFTPSNNETHERWKREGKEEMIDLFLISFVIIIAVSPFVLGYIIEKLAKITQIIT